MPIFVNALFHFFTFSVMTGRFLKTETDRILRGDATGNLINK